MQNVAPALFTTLSPTIQSPLDNFIVDAPTRKYSQRFPESLFDGIPDGLMGGFLKDGCWGQ
jgi:hypothetical protein